MPERSAGKAVQTLHAPYRFPFPLANGVPNIRAGASPARRRRPPARPAAGARGGSARRRRRCRRSQPTSIAWVYGGGAIQYFYARDPNFDVRRYRPEDFAARVREVSELMDSTNPDLSRLQGARRQARDARAHGRLRAEPLCGHRLFREVLERMGEAAVADFLRLYTAPGVDHVGSGAPANVDMLTVLVRLGRAGPRARRSRRHRTEAVQPVATVRALPLCQWPAWPRYKQGDPKRAASFVCAP